jgi:hypothetical protein
LSTLRLITGLDRSLCEGNPPTFSGAKRPWVII